MASFVASALLLSANWMTYIWAVSNGHVVEASLGYFITPLVNVGLGYGLLGERPRRAQWIGAGDRRGRRRLADGERRAAAVDRPRPRPQLRRLRPAAQGRGARRARRADARDDDPRAGRDRRDGLVVGRQRDQLSGAGRSRPTSGWSASGRRRRCRCCSSPLAARQLSLTTLGLLQYLSPTIQFLLGIWLFHEPFSADPADRLRA